MALPQKIQVNAITGASLPSTIDNDINAGLKQPLIDIFGIPDNTNISTAVMTVNASGLDSVNFRDSTANPGAAGKLQRNAASLLFHDGTAARTLVDTATAQTLTTKTLTSPIFGTQVTLDQSTADYTLTWSNPAAGRAISIPDPGGTDVFVFRDMTQTLLNKTVSLANNTVTGTLAQFNTAVSDADLASLAGSETLTNKTINLANNTLTGTLAQFNTALSGADFVSLAGAEVLTNKIIGPSNAVTGTITAGTQCIMNPVANSTTTTTAHGLATQPAFVSVYLECLTAELGYSINDRVFSDSFHSDAVITGGGFMVEADGTNTNIIVHTSGVIVLNKTTQAAARITNANWRIVAVPYKLN